MRKICNKAGVYAPTNEQPEEIQLRAGLTWEMLPKNLPVANRSPRRLITRSGARVRGVFQHARMGRCEWESELERNLYTLLSMSESVSQVFSQPLVLSLSAGEYTPDALVFLTTGKRVWVECKPRCFLDVETQGKLADAALTLFVLGDHFVTVDETQLDNDLPAVTNARFFSTWYEESVDFVPVVPEPKTYADLINRYGHHAINRAVARGELMLDMSAELSPESLLWTTKEGEGYEPDFLRA